MHKAKTGETNIRGKWHSWQDPIFLSAREDEGLVVNRFLRDSIGIDSPRPHARARLHLAAWQGHDALVKALTAKRAVSCAVSV